MMVFYPSTGKTAMGERYPSFSSCYYQTLLDILSHLCFCAVGTPYVACQDIILVIPHGEWRLSAHQYVGGKQAPA
jgi:hypothetical protein